MEVLELTYRRPWRRQPRLPDVLIERINGNVRFPWRVSVPMPNGATWSGLYRTRLDAEDAGRQTMGLLARWT